ncbi:MAG: hypothetical protein ABIE25_04450 [Thermoplasmatota archaeon]|nr:hypothetical protein [Candidatus Thermoplasmatota archaeon]MBU1913982.1 hypothetical protein [Candidatus Thermoplasmatota archaeon]
MGKLELPLPEIGNSLESHAKEIQARIREQTPKDLRDSIVVKAFKKGKETGLAIEYDDRAENFVYMAMEYPKGGGKKESAVHR